MKKLFCRAALKGFSKSILLILLTLASLLNKESQHTLVVSSSGMLVKRDATSRLVSSFFDKFKTFLQCNNYDAHIRILKGASNHGLVSKRVHRVVFNQKAFLKSFIDLNTKLRTEAKNDSS